MQPWLTAAFSLFLACSVNGLDVVLNDTCAGQSDINEVANMIQEIDIKLDQQSLKLDKVIQLLQGKLGKMALLPAWWTWKTVLILVILIWRRVSSALLKLLQELTQPPSWSICSCGPNALFTVSPNPRLAKLEVVSFRHGVYISMYRVVRVADLSNSGFCTSLGKVKPT